MELVASVRHVLPRGRTLPQGAWRLRHKALLALLWAHVIGLPAFGVLRGFGPFHAMVDGLAIAVFAVLATLTEKRPRVASALVAVGLVTSSAVLVHLWGGVIEGHFHFFVMIVLLALYEDWVTFLVAAAYVVVHHGLMGALDPNSVYNHAAAIAHPWRWAVIHGLFVTGAGIAGVISWRLNEEVRAETSAAYRQARESEEHFRSAFENAPIGMALGSIAPGESGCFLQVNEAFCEMTGYPEVELVGRRFADITHPDDVEESSVLFADLVAGRVESYSTEKRYIRADGAVVWGSLSVSLVRDDSGAPLHAIGHVQDVTEQRQAQERLTYHAYHDALTGLPNRRQLIEDLEICVESAALDDPALIVLFDLDGFKAYNDAFGHAAGDSLLTRLGRSLEATVAGRATCYRMGGDEFCLLAPSFNESKDTLVNAATRALSEHGDGFAITASAGSVLVPADASDEAEVLRKADQRMYANKGTGRASAGRQASDALLSALAERDPALDSHQRDVSYLCKAVAEALDVPAEEMAPLIQAAALHDVGKIAVPDAILEKPAPLDEDEWEFMRNHTVIGERILGAAPALSRCAKIVRSSHERFDGSGYPDGLRGEAIPIGSRIIAVCDAFDAMRSNRPYRSAMSEAEAVAELRRHAGKQFDPAVVDAFVHTLSAQRRASVA